ncbi:rhomboid family intramembrane serine protease [Oleidesulfovibrio sp.]|uniref:rhomboid family intramembrane serine protease n=1 Tax=Oleidesulfovibrio sp. TaxID=2909707 RepID=UPI003A876440
MFPIRDSIPRVHRPWAVWTILALNIAVFVFEQGMPDFTLLRFMHLYGVVPMRFTSPEWALFSGYPDSYFPFLSHMFIHSGWLHMIVNMWTLWIFADNIEDVMGPVGFALFYLLCGLSATCVHILFNADSSIPVVGASGAIAGVMGAYLLLYPHSKVLTLIPVLIFPLFFEFPASIYMGIWFITQFFSGVTSIVTPQAGGGIAWWAHLGGFLAGMALLPAFRRNDRCYFCYRPDPRRRSGVIELPRQD